MNPASMHLWRKLNWPNRISLIRLAAVPFFVVLLLNQRDWSWARHVAIVLFVAIGASDALDGYLARYLGQMTRLGRVLDPLADKALITCAAILLASERASVPGAELPNWVVVAIVGKDLWVVGGFLVLHLVTEQTRIHPTWAGKACTLAQIVMVSVVLVAPELNALFTPLAVGTAMATGLGWTVVGLCALAVLSYMRVGLAYLTQDDAPHGPNDTEAKENDAFQSNQ